MSDKKQQNGIGDEACTCGFVHGDDCDVVRGKIVRPWHPPAVERLQVSLDTGNGARGSGVDLGHEPEIFGGN